MEMPISIKDKIEQLALNYPVKQLKAAAEEMTQLYKNESGQGKHLVTKDLQTAAYAVVRMPATFGAVSSAIEYTMESFDGPIASLLDAGAGTGAASIAASCMIRDDLKITCLEREQSMIDFAARIFDEDPELKNAKWIQTDFSVQEIPCKADLVIASYSLNELKEDRRKQVLMNLWKSAEKLLILIEPGTPEGFRQISAARSLLTDAGAYIAAPCPGNEVCRIRDDDWCHFTARIPRSRLHKELKGGDVPYEDEKYTFLAVSKVPVNPAGARILRHPQKEAGKITLTLCTGDGILVKAVTKKDKDLFKKARKSSAGDSF